MSRYIDADNLLKSIYAYVRINSQDVDYIVRLIQDAPTADVVEVVRCRDCEMFKLQDLSYPKHNTKWCVINGFNPQGGDYCSYGERRKDE